MAKANPTLLGNAKNKNIYIKDGGEKHTFIRCPKCNKKFCKETCFNVCPSCQGKDKENK